MNRVILVLTSLAITANLAFAIPIQAQPFDWTDPVVTPVSGDKEFTAAPTPVSKLPGTLTGDNGLILPAGFPEGTAQFGGEAVTVKDLVQGSVATVCFSMPPRRTEWVGSIYRWDDSKWIKQATTISQDSDEASAASACAEIYGDGAYALIMGYEGKPEPKVQPLPVCSQAMRIHILSFRPFDPDPGRLFMPDKYLTRILWIALDGSYPAGTPVTFQIVNPEPAGSIGGPLTQTTSVTPFLGSMQLTLHIDGTPDFTDGSWLYAASNPIFRRFTYRFIFPDCYIDIPNPLGM